MTRSNRRKYQKVIRKEWKRMLALSMACTMTVSMAVPAVAAQEGETSLQTAEAAELQETPEQFEVRTGYHLPDGYTYVWTGMAKINRNYK